jgi:hypothetical protein
LNPFDLKKGLAPSALRFMPYASRLMPSALPASCCLLFLFVSGSFPQEENRKNTATMSEANKKPIDNTGSPLILRKIQINFTEPLYTLCNFPFS